MVKFCAECGAELIGGKKFCSGCGIPMSETQNSQICLHDTEMRTFNSDGRVWCEGCETYIDPNNPQPVSKNISADIPRRTSGKPVAVIITLLIFLGVGYAAYTAVSSGFDSITESFSPNSTPKIPDSSVSVGQVAADGQMSFVLNSQPSCRLIAGINLCKFDLSVSNTSNSAASFLSSDQKLVDSAGRFYDASSSYEDPGYSPSFEIAELNPGVSARGNIYFQLPKGVKAFKLIVHDGLFSGGAAIIFRM